MRQKEAEEEAHEAMRRRDAFLALLSHELRNPLSAIVNSMHLLERANASQEVRERARTRQPALERAQVRPQRRIGRAASAGSEIALVALTGYGRSEDRKRAEEAGFDVHVVKPVEAVELESVIAGLLARRRR